MPLYRTNLPVVTTIPSAAGDGDVVYFQSSGMATDGIVWKFRYNAAASGSYKWEFVGGPPWSKDVDTSETTTSVSYVALTTALERTTPLAGDYYVEQGVQMYPSGSNAFVYFSHSVGGAATTAADADGMFVQQPTATGSVSTYNFRRRRHDAVAASALIAEAARSSSGTGTFLRRSLSLIPIRVSA